MSGPTRFVTSNCPNKLAGRKTREVISKAGQYEKQYDGRSFKMRGFEQLTKGFKVAGVVLLLLIIGLGAKASAQSLNPIPWPTPAAVPTATPIIPPREGR
jgi:hypothetical protein